jgi:hypothetical protein
MEQEACRPGGYFFICASHHALFSGVQANDAG